MSWLSILLVTWFVVGLLAVVVACGIASIAMRQHGYQFERNPIAWIPLISVCLLTALPLLVVGLVVLFVVVPVFALVSAFGVREYEKVGHQVRLLDQGLEITNEKGTIERLVEWESVERAEEVFRPPIMGCPRLVLKDGEHVWLDFVDVEQLALVLEQRGIAFDRERI